MLPNSASHTMSPETATIQFCGDAWLLDARGVSYHPSSSTLIVSDMHLEKGSFLGQFNHPLPPYDTRDTLVRLHGILQDYAPQRVVCLGDSFHDVHADKRLAQADIDYLRELMQSVPQWSWVLGNHDPDVPEFLGGQRVPSCMLGDITLVHEPEEIDTPQIIGHFHPKTSIRVARKKVQGRCFLYNPRLMLMPSFGSYTGGLDIRHRAINGLFYDATPSCYLLHLGKIWPCRG